jgi:hypothetical protein
MIPSCTDILRLSGFSASHYPLIKEYKYRHAGIYFPGVEAYKRRYGGKDMKTVQTMLCLKSGLPISNPSICKMCRRSCRLAGSRGRRYNGPGPNRNKDIPGRVILQ